ncbi:glutamate synthase large subunit [Pseudonocardia sp. KRD-184]|uniref:Glutamate synthase large subunit n=1 Tax=Pseudonocardia oceani TaxID=2792013 RepID=A0ABS6U581_9PSEU|nr:glutamate synthase large subunit [Pseudonocardia oceani]MBW0089632.1 glutamate synthase large subunit [Pseudonocardia oceani]MBW0095309.1 glutamate synthase large subunit [Pseudonocardia oceani]MBW0107960.1 glutamate synthase large subunit [Pseudonocardia oceani]MBW0121775.1 glutamate synthase large subunit [Pseudonocardia oceani]MBW0127388.1 glutamate synthase large subunit [Pseudonocardia oceani]
MAATTNASGTAVTSEGLYAPDFEHDACGVAMVADLSGRRGHSIVRKALTALLRLEHRGARGAEANTGDGAGILIQLPDAFFREVVDFALPEDGSYAAGTAFLPADPAAADAAVAEIDRLAAEEGLTVLGWRELPVDPDGADIGPSARAAMPGFRQLFVAGAQGETGIALERLTFCLRKRAEHTTGTYFPSLSPRTIVYKGMLAEPQVEAFYPDLSDERVTSALAVVHSRFSTNTFPAWPLAHPYRYVAHNGEINTLRGNRNWMASREALLQSELIPGDLARLSPIVTPDASDSATFDEVLELLHLGGRSLPHAVLMMIPEAWENHDEMDPARRAFYEFHSTLMEPWDGPALVAFTDGTLVGAVLDRNGLRPARYWVTDDGIVVLASEVGVLDVEPSSVVRKGRLEPGRMFLVDTAAGKLVDDAEIKGALAAEHPYADWLHAGLIRLEELPARDREVPSHAALTHRQQSFGYTEEELTLLLKPMAAAGAEPIGSMGNDAPIAAISERPRSLFDYFIQLFAQVTNPPLDAIREELVTSLQSQLGPEQNLLDATPANCRTILLPFPVLGNDDLAKIVHINDDGELPGFACVTAKGVFKAADGGAGMKARLNEICREVSEAIEDGARLIVLSNRGVDATHAPIPSLLLTGAVHHHLVRERTRSRVGLVVESGDAREVHHIALLIGYGAAAVNPYLAMATVEDLAERGDIPGVDPATAAKNLVKALGKGVRKTMSKIGVSTVASYTGAQIFEAIGLGKEVVDECFCGTTSRLGGVGYDVLAEEVLSAHRRAFPGDGVRAHHRALEVGGEYQWRREGELHLFNPQTVFKLQHSTRAGRYDIFKDYTRAVDEQAHRLMTLRGLFAFKEGLRAPVPLDEVEPVEEIVKRFGTGAISYGSISQEMHETLAIAMNRLGGRSNTGEGGEDSERWTPDANGDSRRSAVKQVASGRFGVTSEYLVNADDIQIKIAQGAKPGEGGQLPGGKVYPWIAKTRFATPGVGLISPPPHHDIYSIEDIKQLIHDLKNANPRARIHVKLVSQVGVGTVAAGVAKAYSDVVLISGHDGGTGASPLSSIKHAGGPWELGLAETQQTLLRNNLRDRIVVQADGQLKTGRDVVIAALLGAEEFGFATAPLVVSGCIMMRVCHLDTCPVGVATQNPELRKRFDGRPEYVVNFMRFIAEEVREYLAALGFRSIDEAVGHAEVLETDDAVRHWKTEGIDLSPIFATPDVGPDTVLHRTRAQDHGLEKALDNTLIQLCEGALRSGDKVHLDLPVRNVNRTVGTMLGYELTRKWGGEGLPDDTIDVTLTGSAGQSFGAFVPRGITLRLVGDTNDFFGKGLSGGRLTLRPDPTAPFAAEDNIIAGNVILYGATSGEIFVRGIVGERFCVRNSGALAVVEGVGDHGCEYMTGGRVVVLGKIGRNFAAGMSGGVAYVLDLPTHRVNPEMVDLDPLDDDDRAFLRDAVEKHYAETESAVAKTLLTEWDDNVGRFGKVMPRDFKRVLEAREAAEREGRNVDEAVMEAAHG